MTRSWIVFICVASLTCGLLAQTTQKTGVIYVPKKVGQTKQRTDGATRGGVEQPPPMVRVLTPVDTALVASDTPALYWFISQPTRYRCDVVVKTLKDEPIFESSHEKIEAAGVVPVDLSKADKKLEPGKDYRFVVLITVEPVEPASDIESSGTLRYEPLTPDLQQQLAGAKGVAKAAIYAQNGYFIDAVATLKADNSPEAAAALKDLLMQVGLDLAAK